MKTGAGMVEPPAFSPQAPGPFRRLLQNPEVLAAILFIATLFVFRNVRHFDFINFDDPEYVTSNPQVRDGLSMNGIFWALTTTHASNWHPVTWLSHMLDSSLFGEGPAGLHVVNLLFHATNAVLLFFWFRRVSGRQSASLWVAAIFSLHPLRVESVAWVSERKDVLSTFFWLLTLIAYARYVELARLGPSSETGTSDLKVRSRRWYFLALAVFALGLMSKPMLVTGPVLLLLLDFWPLGRLTIPGKGSQTDWTKTKAGFANLVREKVPFFVLSLACAVMTFIAQHHAGAVAAMEELPVLARLENTVVAYVSYLGKFLWPVNLAVPYPFVHSWPRSTLLFACVVVFALSVLAFWLIRRRPYLFTGWFWFLGTLLPVIGLVQVGNQAMADRYTYFPAIGLSIAIVWSLIEGVRFVGASGVSPSSGAAEARKENRLGDSSGLKLSTLAAPEDGLTPLRRSSVLVLSGVAILSLAASAWKTDSQLGYWRDSETLFRHAIRVTDGNYLAYDNLGFQLYQTGRVPEAMQYYQKALQIRSDDPNTLNNVGSAMLSTGNDAAAVKAYESALRSQPRFADAHNNLGIALAHLNKNTEAERHYREALRLDPDSSEAHNNLANLLAGRGNLAEAVFHYRAAITLNPQFTQALNNLGYILEQQGDYAASIETYSKALRLKPNDAVLHSNLAEALAKAGNNKGAVEHYETALRLSPDLADAHASLGILLAHIGQTEAALGHLRRALVLNPGDSDTRRKLDALERTLPPNKSQ